MASMSAWMTAQPRSNYQRASRTPAALRIIDAPVLLTVWMLCVLTDWSTPAKVALNAAAVALLCLKEVAVHRYMRREAPVPNLVLVPAPA
ncbi:hypothetical protein [Arthrobacter sp. 7Tela_A1]|uniref:hypothetical protein n=1 Tax=Arthrobacter sp. 7Tela_A1 TaxID=3093745 RepID=UPI003BB609C4